MVASPGHSLCFSRAMKSLEIISISAAEHVPTSSAADAQVSETTAAEFSSRRWVTDGTRNVIFKDKIMRIDQKVTNGHEIGIQRQERKAWTLGTHRGKNTRIPMYDAGDGKVLLAYYVEGRRNLVKCQSLEAGRKRAKQIIRISRPAMLTWVTLPPVRLP